MVVMGILRSKCNGPGINPANQAIKQKRGFGYSKVSKDCMELQKLLFFPLQPQQAEFPHTIHRFIIPE